MNENKMFCDRCNKEINNPFIYISEIDHQYLCDNCFEKEQPKELTKQIDQLKQQLEEYKNKGNTSAVNSWDEMLKNCENCGLNECIGCEYTQTCVQNIKQQLAEKDKEIEMLNTIKNNAIECADLFKVALSVRQKDLAIHELEKVKEWLEPKYFDYEQINYLTRIIDQQIKELKGE